MFSLGVEGVCMLPFIGYPVPKSQPLLSMYQLRNRSHAYGERCVDIHSLDLHTEFI